MILWVSLCQKMLCLSRNVCLLLLDIVLCNVASLLVLDKGVIPLEKDSVAIQFYIDIENKNKSGMCYFYTRVKKCLLDLTEDSHVFINVFSETFGTIQPRNCKTLIYVFPTTYLHDLVGFCDIILAYSCPNRKNRMIVNIPFDTRSNGKSSFLLEKYTSGEKLKVCETIDQNSLDDCLPVHCDLKYSGVSLFYSTDIKRCVEAPICIGNPDKDLPTTAYEPQINICNNLGLTLTMQDIYVLSTGLGTVTQSAKDYDYIVKLKSNCSTISQNLYLLRDLLYGKLCPCDKEAKIDYGAGCKSAVLNIVISIISVCAILLSCVCCVNTTVWVHRQWVDGNLKEFMLKIRSKFKTTEKCHKFCKNNDIRNSLLREVTVKDIPLELRDSVASVCDRMEKEVREKKRYRNSDIGSQISLLRAETDFIKHET